MPPPDEDGNPWHYFHEPKEDRKILYWGVFDILPWGDCWPIPFTHSDYPCSMGFF